MDFYWNSSYHFTTQNGVFTSGHYIWYPEQRFRDKNTPQLIPKNKAPYERSKSEIMSEPNQKEINEKLLMGLLKSDLRMLL